MIATQQRVSEEAVEERTIEDSPSGLRDRRPAEGKTTLAGAGLFEREEEEMKANAIIEMEKNYVI